MSTCPNCGCDLVFNADHAASCPHTNLRHCSAAQLPRATVEALEVYCERLEERIATLERQLWDVRCDNAPIGGSS